jgi:hypothetical protein
MIWPEAGTVEDRYERDAGTSTEGGGMKFHLREAASLGLPFRQR